MRRTLLARSTVVCVALALAGAACSGGRNDAATGGGGSGGTAGTTPSGAKAFTIDTAKCSDYQPTQGITDSEIKIGTSLPQAGAYGAAFGPIMRGYKAWFDYQNAEKKGVKGRKLTLIAKDDEYKPDKTRTNVQELVQKDKVFALFNVVGTANNLAIRDDLNDSCVPNLLVATGAVQWGQTDAYPWLIGSLPSYATEAAVFADYLKKNKPNATVGILKQNDDFGDGYAKAFNTAIQGTGIKVVKEEKYDAGVSDVTSQITSIAAAKPDAVLSAAAALACPNALKSIKAQQGWTPITYVSVTCAVKFLVDLGGKDAFAGTFSVAYLKDPADPAFANDPAIKEFQTIGKKYGMTDDDLTNGGVLYGWAMGQLLTRVLETAPELNRKSVMETAYSLRDVKLDSFRDGLAINTNGATDPFPIESLYFAKFNGTGYAPDGPLINMEGKTKQFITN